MKFLMKFTIDVETGNKVLKDPEFGAKMQQCLEDVGAQATYFTAQNGKRGGLILVEINDGSEIPAKAEPLFSVVKC